MAQKLTKAVFHAVTEKQDGDSGLSDQAHENEPGSFLRHVLSLSCSKSADGLIDPKLVLSWLLTSLGAGAFWVGLLVPVRESGALLPQLFTTPVITRSAIRKWYWAGGSFVQGLAAAGIAVAGLTLQGQTAGIVIVAFLAVLAVARSVCSASYKDVLGKTVGTSHRGTATGLAGSIAAAGVIVFAGILLLGIGDRAVLVTGAILLASALWMIAALVFATLKEVRSDTGSSAATGLAQFKLLREHPQLTRFIAVRSLLIGTALAPPFLVMLQPDSGFGQLGGLVLASALAALLSSYVWGRLSDRSSRRVLQLAGIWSGGLLALVIVADLLGFSTVTGVIPVMLFGLMIAYQGVRQGRSTHLVDMAQDGQRAQFTALSNTIVGVILLGGGAVFAAIASVSVLAVIGLFAVMCLLAAWLATGLDNVQG